MKADINFCGIFGGSYSVMVSFLNVLDDTKRKLGRPLQKEETKFLQWMYERYQREQKERSKCLEIKNVN